MKKNVQKSKSASAAAKTPEQPKTLVTAQPVAAAAKAETPHSAGATGKGAKKSAGKPATGKTQAAPKSKYSPRGPANPHTKPRKMGGLSAAAKVLADAGKPMRCVDMMEKIRAKGLWKTSGKTPAATINAAVIREIKTKGRESRFKKVGRGMFAATAHAKQ